MTGTGIGVMGGSNSVRRLSWVCFMFVVLAAGCDRTPPPPPDPPITSIVKFTWRHSLLRPDTGVLRITNTSPLATPPMRLRYTNQDSGQTAIYDVMSIKPGATAEFGVLESGWAIEPNEFIEAASPGYKPQELYFYKTTAGEMVMSHGYAAKKGQQIAERIGNALK